VATALLDRLTYWYPAAEAPALDRVDLRLEPGLTLVAGASGSGKSSLLRALNGLVPHFHGGRLAGRAVVAGLETSTTATRVLAREVGFVFQDPEAQLVYATVENEIAFGLENLRLPRLEMAVRVGEAAAAVGIEGLLGRQVASLSGGERQRVALAGALVLRPRLLALDEPASQLDSDGAAAIARACRQLAEGGMAVVVAEHRVQRLLAAARQLVLMDSGRVEASGRPRDLAGRLPAPPQVVELGRRLGWRPLPLTEEEAAPLMPALKPPRAARRERRGEVAWSLAGVTAGPGPRPVLEHVDLDGVKGEVTVLMGPNGGGKTTLLRTVAGLLEPVAGQAQTPPGRVAYLPQNPTALLHQPTLQAEVELTLHRAGSSEPAAAILSELGLAGLEGRYPRDLSGGQRERAALAAVLAGSPDVALLDEPTRGMDGAARDALVALVRRLAAGGSSVILATHDSDLAGEVGDRVVEVIGGGVRDQGPPEQALAGSGPLATQIGRLYPGGPVTVAGVMARL
jgi:energy-coupling factor transport system ATP-binding protein